MVSNRPRLDLEEDYYHRPKYCPKCGGVMIFKGVGEYQCEKCKEVAYDDYGKVRNYIELHPGTTAAEIEEKIGVKQKTIRQLLRESRIQVAADSKTFILCEICKKPIRSGRFCSNCEKNYHKGIEEKLRKESMLKKMQSMKGMENKKEVDNKSSNRYMGK